ncbi:hypothetical protein WA158_002015 [Blastocystis sp. Blastoise]
MSASSKDDSHISPFIPLASYDSKNSSREIPQVSVDNIHEYFDDIHKLIEILGYDNTVDLKDFGNKENHAKICVILYMALQKERRCEDRIDAYLDSINEAEKKTLCTEETNSKLVEQNNELFENIESNYSIYKEGKDTEILSLKKENKTLQFKLNQSFITLNREVAEKEKWHGKLQDILITRNKDISKADLPKITEFTLKSRMNKAEFDSVSTQSLETRIHDLQEENKLFSTRIKELEDSIKVLKETNKKNMEIVRLIPENLYLLLQYLEQSRIEHKNNYLNYFQISLPADLAINNYLFLILNQYIYMRMSQQQKKLNCFFNSTQDPNDPGHFVRILTYFLDTYRNEYIHYHNMYHSCRRIYSFMQSNQSTSTKDIYSNDLKHMLSQIYQLNPISLHILHNQLSPEQEQSLIKYKVNIQQYISSSSSSSSSSSTSTSVSIDTPTTPLPSDITPTTPITPITPSSPSTPSTPSSPLKLNMKNPLYCISEQDIILHFYQFLMDNNINLEESRKMLSTYINTDSIESYLKDMNLDTIPDAIAQYFNLQKDQFKEENENQFFAAVFEKIQKILLYYSLPGSVQSTQIMKLLDLYKDEHVLYKRDISLAIQERSQVKELLSDLLEERRILTSIIDMSTSKEREEIRKESRIDSITTTPLDNYISSLKQKGVFPSEEAKSIAETCKEIQLYPIDSDYSLTKVKESTFNTSANFAATMRPSSSFITTKSIPSLSSSINSSTNNINTDIVSTTVDTVASDIISSPDIIYLSPSPSPSPSIDISMSPDTIDTSTSILPTSTVDNTPLFTSTAPMPSIKSNIDSSISISSLSTSQPIISTTQMTSNHNSNIQEANICHDNNNNKYNNNNNNGDNNNNNNGDNNTTNTTTNNNNISISKEESPVSIMDISQPSTSGTSLSSSLSSSITTITPSIPSTPPRIPHSIPTPITPSPLREPTVYYGKNTHILKFIPKVNKVDSSPSSKTISSSISSNTISPSQVSSIATNISTTVPLASNSSNIPTINTSASSTISPYRDISMDFTSISKPSSIPSPLRTPSRSSHQSDTYSSSLPRYTPTTPSRIPSIIHNTNNSKDIKDISLPSPPRINSNSISIITPSIPSPFIHNTPQKPFSSIQKAPQVPIPNSFPPIPSVPQVPINTPQKPFSSIQKAPQVPIPNSFPPIPSVPQVPINTPQKPFSSIQKAPQVPIPNSFPPIPSVPQVPINTPQKPSSSIQKAPQVPIPNSFPPIPSSPLRQTPSGTKYVSGIPLPSYGSPRKLSSTSSTTKSSISNNIPLK